MRSTEVRLADFNPRGDFFRTPKGYFVIFAHNWGRITMEHLNMADEYWEKVCALFNFNPNRLRHFPFLLERTAPFTCGDKEGAAGCHYDYGHDYRGHIAAIGGFDYMSDWDDQPEEFKKWELERIWRHEMIHQLFLLRYGDNDPDHKRVNEWECQYPEWGEWH